jgi:hypothetical protein
MEDMNESALRAGFVLRMMRELAEHADANRQQLKDIQVEARLLQEKWQSLMHDMSGTAEPRSPVLAVAHPLLEVLLRRCCA